MQLNNAVVNVVMTISALAITLSRSTVLWSRVEEKGNSFERGVTQGTVEEG